MPFELRPYPNETLKPDGDYLQRAWQKSVYPIARQLGVPIKLPTVSPQPHLDGKYTVFGKVVHGDALLDQLAQWDVIDRIQIWDGVSF